MRVLSVLSVSDMILLQMSGTCSYNVSQPHFHHQNPPLHEALTGLLRQCPFLLIVIDSLNAGEYGFN